MQALTTSEASDWATKRGVRILSAEGPPDLSLGDAARWRFLIPSDAGRRVGLAKLLWHQLGASQPECLVWIGTHSVWPSGEHLPLFHRWRDAVGMPRSTADAPGMLFRLGEDDDALSGLLWPILFLWDAYFLPGSGQSLLELSHDEWGIISFRDTASAAEAEHAFRWFDLALEALQPVAG